MISNKDFIGQKFNDWEVIGWEHGKKGIEWICRCKCGFIKQQKVDNIKNGRSKMCKKCYAKSRHIEKEKQKYLGQKFNRLTVIEIISGKGNVDVIAEMNTQEKQNT